MAEKESLNRHIEKERIARHSVVSLIVALLLSIALFHLMRFSFFIQLLLIALVAVIFLFRNSLGNVIKFKKYHWPQIFLISITITSFFMVVWYSDQYVFNVKSGIYRGLLALAQSPKETFLDQKIYTFAQPVYGKFLQNNVEDGSSILFLNDKSALSGGMSIYYNIHLYMDSNIRYFFDTKDKQFDERMIIKNMQDNGIKYLFRFEVKDNILNISAADKGKSILYKLEDNQLKIVGVM